MHASFTGVVRCLCFALLFSTKCSKLHGSGLIFELRNEGIRRFSKRFDLALSSWAYRAGGGAEGAAAPQFVGQTKPVGQYSLHSRAILAYYKNKWDKFCQFCGKFCQFCGKYAI
jgi:hypothetical protein